LKDDMEEIILFSDLHFTAGDTIIGLDPLVRFDEAAASALTDHPDASHIVFMGDLTHHGTFYCRARRLWGFVSNQ